MELKVVVLTIVGMLRGSVPMATEVHRPGMLAERLGGIKVHAGEIEPVSGYSIRVVKNREDLQGEIWFGGVSGIILSR